MKLFGAFLMFLNCVTLFSVSGDAFITAIGEELLD